MADDETDARDLEEDEPDADEAQEASRGDDLSKRAGIRKALLAIFADVEAGFSDQWERANDQIDYWDAYNCKLGSRQFYSGNSKIYVPIIHNALEARVTRFCNQIFPQSERCVEVTSQNGDIPFQQVSLLEHYVKKAKLRTKVIPAMIKNGDIEGQYNLYVSWRSIKRHVTFKKKQPVPMAGMGMPNPAAPEVTDIARETVQSAYPEVEVLADADMLVLPQTSDELEEAIADGGSVTVIRRWGKTKIRRMIKEGAIRKDVGDFLIGQMSETGPPGKEDQKKNNVDAAGIKGEVGSRYALVYETWTNLKVRNKEAMVTEDRLCQAFFGGDEQILGCRLNPNWSDRLPIISAPVSKTAGVFKGVSKLKFCIDLQYAANDAVNEGWDSAAYALMPIIMTDPEKNPRVGSMVLNLAAVWETSPKDTQFAQFPQLWQHAFEMVSACKSEVSQTLSVSPAAITQGIPGNLRKSKPSQSEIAQEQQVDIMSTADAVTAIEHAVLNTMLERFIELDHQHRTEEMTVRAYGEMGLKAEMLRIEPVQFDQRYTFRWFGVEASRNTQQIQQQIAGLNVIRGIPPQAMPGYQLNIAPIVMQLVENTFGPRLAPLILQDQRQMLTLEPDVENKMLLEGFDLNVHPGDDDPKHMQSHMQLMQMGDLHGVIRIHLGKHQQAMQLKQAMQMMQAAEQMGGGQGGAPGGQPGQPPQQNGQAGTPRIGAQPGMPRMQGPPGSIHEDQMTQSDPGVMQRKALQ